MSSLEPTQGSESEPGLNARARAVLKDIARLTAERADAETRANGARASGDTSADQEYQRAREALEAKYAEVKQAELETDTVRRRSLIDSAIAGETEAKTEFARSSRRIASEFDGVREYAKKDHARARAAAAAGFEAGEREAFAAHAAAVRPVDDASKVVASLRERLAVLFADYQKFGLSDPTATPTREIYRSDETTGLLHDRLGKVEAPLKLLEGLVIPKVMKGTRWLWVFVVPFLGLVYPLTTMTDPAFTGVGIAAVASVVIGFALRTWLFALSKSQVSRSFYPIHQSLIDADALAAHCRGQAADRLKVQRLVVAERRDKELEKAKTNHATTVSTGESVRDDRLREINERYARLVVDVHTRQQADMLDAAEAFDRRRREVQLKFEAGTRKLEEKYQTLKDRIRSQYATVSDELASSWRDGMTRSESALEQIQREVKGYAPGWEAPEWNDRPWPRCVPPVIKFGTVTVPLESLPGGAPADPALRDQTPVTFTFPAVMPFPTGTNLLIETPLEGRIAAVEALQTVMTRLLTSLPPGQVRFTIVDPLGIGRNFGAFMHLADFDEALVNGQVWTEPRQIEERLAELSAHMEKVTQKYLRNEYATIEEYNAVAGEVAEPYRVLVVADFPSQFDEKAAARLAAITAGGVSCGVVTLVALDTARPMPPGFDVETLRQRSTRLTWAGDRLAWDDPDLGPFPLQIDKVPSADLANRLIQKAGAAARDAKRVEVPFEFIAPPREAWWTKDSRAGIDVPLGKAGASKRQHLTLGQGTSQHVLIAGRTGSGKSTLLHALITNLALNYSPDEIELYLIDFKKGVEFKVYATQELPHAGVVAIESEREFGISVLQRLDSEMRQRADRFRDAGVQDLNGYRNAPGSPPLPRVLLIVDEFQEFFVEEDKIAQEAALLLDRLVRQGRAFGVHVHLGSQTLGGAYALARSTLGQMAVRIALQCSDADAPMILSEQNTAARLLSRPGEAVYNDANGQAEGNHFFQVVWLSDESRESYLRQIRELARERPPLLRRTPIVFEGDAPADLARNVPLRSLLDGPTPTESSRAASAWLGDPVAIKEPTAAVFRRQGANHLLVVGQNTDAALGVMTAALVSLASQFAPPISDTVRGGARIAVLDGTPEDDPHAGYLTRVAGCLPLPVAVGGWRDASRVVAEFAEDVKRRQQPDAPDGPELFLFVFDLARFRDLRRREDDFGFGRRDEEASAADRLETIVKEGPGLGVHLIAWCDTLNNVNRAFSNQMLRELGMRVLFQMSPNDSALLLDAPYASKLGPHRALFYSEEQNRLEKFRPYGLPGDEWLSGLGDRANVRSSPAGG